MLKKIFALVLSAWLMLPSIARGDAATDLVEACAVRAEFESALSDLMVTSIDLNDFREVLAKVEVFQKSVPFNANHARGKQERLRIEKMPAFSEALHNRILMLEVLERSQTERVRLLEDFLDRAPYLVTEELCKSLES